MDYVAATPVATYLSRPRNLQCHNFLEKLPLPRGTRGLLGYGAKFCIRQPLPTNDTKATFA